MLGRIEKADIAAMMFLQKKVRRPYLDFIFRWVTRLGNGAAIWIILSHVLYFYISHRAGLTVICNIFIMDSISNFLIKPFVRRKRPWEKLPEITVLIHKPKDSSFPSGHSACAVSSAFMVGHFVDPLPFTLIYLLALLMWACIILLM